MERPFPEEAILRHLYAFFAARLPAEALGRFETQKPANLLTNSMEALDLVLHLEEKLGVELPLDEIGPAVASQTFGALAGAIQRQLGGGETRKAA